MKSSNARKFASLRSYFFNQAIAAHFADYGVYADFESMRLMFKEASKLARLRY